MSLEAHKSSSGEAREPRPSEFPNTRWSVILDAQQAAPTALASFCSTYWFPLYSYARRMNLSVTDAEDLTQSFFERLLSRELLGHARRERGRLRNFLLHSFKNFAAEEWRKAGAQKRRPDLGLVQIDALSAEERLAVEPKLATTPELEYERAWARELLRQTLEKLEASYKSAGNQTLFDAMRDQLADGFSDQSYKEIAATLGSTEAAVRFGAFKLRQKYRVILHEIVADTVPQETDVEGELAHLQSLFQR
jgi:RNA polymerase sigma factor (sigma-70 family)